MTAVKRISFEYSISWFSFDVISTVPFDTFVALGAAGTDVTKQLRLIRLLRLVRLLRIVRLVRIFNRLEVPMEKLGITEAVRLVSIVGIIVLISHWIACIMWLTTVAEGVIGNGTYAAGSDSLGKLVSR